MINFLKNKAILIVFAIFIFVAAGLFIPLQQKLCITKSKNNEIIMLFDDSNNGFKISYTHSVNQGRVVDSYIVSGTKLLLTCTNFVSYGAGTPEPQGTQIFIMDDDKIEISNINLELNELVLQTGITADHHFSINGEDFAFNDFILPQTRITIGIKNVSLYEILKHSIY